MEAKDTAFFVVGHRPLKIGGYDPNNTTAKLVKKMLTSTIVRLYKKGYTAMLNGMAVGADQYAVEVALACRAAGRCPGLKIVACVVKGQELKWPEEAQRKYYELLRKVDDVHVVCSTCENASQAMQLRNQFVVDHASMGIGVWDGSRGGVYNCLNYAAKNKLPILWINFREHKICEI